MGFHFYCTILGLESRYEAIDVASQILFCLKYLGCPVIRFSNHFHFIAAFGAGGIVLFGASIALLRYRLGVACFTLLPYVAVALYPTFRGMTRAVFRPRGAIIFASRNVQG